MIFIKAMIFSVPYMVCHFKDPYLEKSESDLVM